MRSVRMPVYGEYVLVLLLCSLIVTNFANAAASSGAGPDQARMLDAKGPGFPGENPGRMPFGGPRMGGHGPFAIPPEVTRDHYDPSIVAVNEKSPFGVDAPFTKKGNPFDWNGEEGGRLLRELGIGWIMPSATFGIGPLTITPSASGLDFRRLDRYVLNAQASNVHILFVISPREASPSAPPAPPQYPRDLDNYLKVVRAAVERYDGDGRDDMPGSRYPVKYWMVLNEPFFKRYWAGSAEEYCRLFIQTHRAVKEADPGAKVVLSSLINPHMKDTYSFAEQFFACYRQALSRKEAPASVDVVDLHWISRQEADQAYEEYKRGLDWLTGQLRQMGVNIQEVICTEACVLTRDREEVARDVVKRYLLARSLGIAKVFWSSLVSADPQRDFFTAISLKTMPEDAVLKVYRFMVRNVGTGACKLKRPQSGVFEVRVKNGPTVWWRDGAAKTGPTISAKDGRDVYGQSLTPGKVSVGVSPIYSLE